MKKLFCLCVALMLLTLPAISLASTDLTNCAIANATVGAVRFVDVTAPCSGTLSTFDLASGDSVSAGQTLMSMQVTSIYAPENGKVAALFANVGDDAESVIARYGAVAAIEPAQLMRITASTAGAYNAPENRTIHTGEIVYFFAANNRNREGIGRVIQVDGKNYVVEVISGSLEIGNAANLYRADTYIARDCIGRGQVIRCGDALVKAQGRVVKLYVKEGDEVTAGQKLMDVLSTDAAPGISPDIIAPENGVIASVQAMPGQQVARGQVLLRINLTGALEVVASVDEMDLGNLHVGDLLAVSIDADNRFMYTGQVTQISALGVAKTNAAYFEVHIALPEGAKAMMGASASVYIPR